MRLHFQNSQGKLKVVIIQTKHTESLTAINYYLKENNLNGQYTYISPHKYQLKHVICIPKAKH